ncbi:solute carrier family 2, facilitated glucose transporter member 5-like [Lytechinus variegatus]|uniref:solute carrier family 2, facilitated glucose transporter member 5-like n=1 Tax=Lytechinus variegatus TaxID=7654 RepID=UPI001BB273EF|nr:solute carrier family 2, facilitated glucose transporter member 5-like [Lytechinus variegatus]
MEDLPNGNVEEFGKSDGYNANISQENLTDVKPKFTTGRPTVWLVISVIAVTFGSSAQYGYGIGVLTGPSLMMQDFYNQSNYDRNGVPLSDTGVLWLWSTTVSVWCIGGALGAMVGGYLSDGLGRKGALLMINIFSLVAAVLFGFAEMANSYEMVIIGRLIHGFYVGKEWCIVNIIKW